MSAATRSVAAVTVSRSDWGHQRPVLEAIRSAPGLSLQLYVAGMHLESAFGLTVREIERDGWPIAARISMAETDDSPHGVAASTGKGIEGFARAYAETRPDLVVVLGDRFEMLAAAVAALPFTLPVAHVHGGEETEGAMDNQIRHAITKLAHLHFASADAHARRLAQLGEEAWRIYSVGAPGVDRLSAVTYRSREELAGSLGLDAGAKWLVVTFHPVTLEFRNTAAHVAELMAALEKADAQIIMTYPNADTASRVIVERIEEFASRHPRVRLARSLGEEIYLSLLKHADAMVGNSSSGLIEAPSFGLPVVNIGSRQRGRLRAANVIDVGYSREEILRGLEKALDPGFRAALKDMANPYGDGRAAARIVEVLRAIPLDARLIQKRFGGGGAAS
jgi:GDP/UDP-N,N'-diacetylbacillosamine 2-epimerase (hydrolysing)